MVYKAIGVMSGSSLDGLDIVLAELEESAGTWKYDIVCSHCYEFDNNWKEKLIGATDLNALEYQLLHTAFGHYMGKKMVEFINSNDLSHQVHFIACHGHTTFHLPKLQMTHQLGEGAAIAAETGLPVITDFRSLDIALGGQGAPIVPIGENLLFPEFYNFLNIGGIANISFKDDNRIIGFDICPANKVLNMLAEDCGFKYDEDGKIAAKGTVILPLLNQLNDLEYYKLSHPKSLANSFGIDIVYPLIKSFKLKEEDSLATYVEHITIQVFNAFKLNGTNKVQGQKLLVTGGGALNKYLIKKLSELLKNIGIEVYLPGNDIINYKEALIIALMGTLRWREQNNVLSSVTGSSRNSIGGSLWMGGEG